MIGISSPFYEPEFLTLTLVQLLGGTSPGPIATAEFVKMVTRRGLPDRLLRIAIPVLASIESEDACRAIVDLYLRGNAPVVPDEVLFPAFGRSRDPKAVPLLTDALIEGRSDFDNQNHASGEGRFDSVKPAMKRVAAACKALAMIADERARPELAFYANKRGNFAETKEVVETAIFALTEMDKVRQLERKR